MSSYSKGKTEKSGSEKPQKRQQILLYQVPRVHDRSTHSDHQMMCCVGCWRCMDMQVFSRQCRYDVGVAGPCPRGVHGEQPVMVGWVSGVGNGRCREFFIQLTRS